MADRPLAVVAGASGFIGAALVRAFTDDGYDVTTIRRAGDVTWGDPARIAQAIDGSAVLVNLAGKSVDCRYTDRNRDEILRSRVDTTRALREAVTDAVNPPLVWLNASTATIYRHAMDRPNTETNGELGEGFSVDVARAWEQEFFIAAIRFLRDRGDITGPVNLASPRPSDNRELMRTLRRAVGKPIGLPAGRWMLEPSMWVLRTEPELVLKSRWALPGSLTAAGFAFQHPDLEQAVTAVVARREAASASRSS